MTKFTKKELLNLQLPIILLYGNDTFSIDEMLSKLISNLMKNGNDRSEYIYLDADDKECSQMSIVDAASQCSMLTENRIVLVRRFNKLFEKKKKTNVVNQNLINYLEHPNPTTCLILAASLENEKLDFSTLPYKLLKDYAFEFQVPYDDKLPAWVINRFKENDVNIDLETAELIVAQTDSNLSMLANEIEKILLFYIGKQCISLQDVINISGNSKQYSVFDLIKSVGNRNMLLSISIMNNLLSISSQEILIITLLRDFFIKVWKLQELQMQNVFTKDELIRRIGLRSAYFFGDYVKASKLYNSEDISKVFLILAEADKNLKSTSSNSKLIIEQALVNIIRQTA